MKISELATKIRTAGQALSDAEQSENNAALQAVKQLLSRKRNVYAEFLTEKLAVPGVEFSAGAPSATSWGGLRYRFGAYVGHQPVSIEMDIGAHHEDGLNARVTSTYSRRVLASDWFKHLKAEDFQYPAKFFTNKLVGAIKKVLAGSYDAESDDLKRYLTEIKVELDGASSTLDTMLETLRSKGVDQGVTELLDLWQELPYGVTDRKSHVNTLLDAIKDKR
jgi:hypothetical protein